MGDRNDRISEEEVVDKRAESRLELSVDGSIAELVYELDGNRLILSHTGVPEELSGRGIGGLLVRRAVAIARAEQLTLVPKCPFARRWLRKHEDEAETVAIDWR